MGTEQSRAECKTLSNSLASAFIRCFPGQSFPPETRKRMFENCLLRRQECCFEPQCGLETAQNDAIGYELLCLADLPNIP